jgi:hypothetical protein
MSSPNDGTLLVALREYRALHPALARVKVVEHLQAQNRWLLRKEEHHEATRTDILCKIGRTVRSMSILDSRGEPVYDKAKHGKYVFLVLKIDSKGRECGQMRERFSQERSNSLKD